MKEVARLKKEITSQQDRLLRSVEAEKAEQMRLKREAARTVDAVRREWEQRVDSVKAEQTQAAQVAAQRHRHQLETQRKQAVRRQEEAKETYEGKI